MSSQVEGRLTVEHEAKQQFRDVGLPVPAGLFVDEVGAVASAAASLQFPIVVKASGSLLHKAAIGGVVLNVQNSSEAGEAAERIENAAHEAGVEINGFLLEEQVPEGLEVFASAFFDANFGQVTVLGMGGALVEVLDDVGIRLGTISRADVDAMLSGLRSHQLFEGSPGSPAFNREALIDVVLQMSGANGLFDRFNDLISVEFNPIIVTSDSATVVDIVSYAGERRSTGRIIRKLDLDPLFFPKVIAVAGASANKFTMGNRFLEGYQEFGFKGHLWAVHPTASDIGGLPCRPTVAEIPEHVDYVKVAVSTGQALDVVTQCKDNASVIQVVTTGFAESGAEGRAIEEAMVQAAHDGGSLLVGPNCIGAYCPAGGQTFVGSASTLAGSISAVVQSGGFAGDLIREGECRGMRFAKVLSIGNASDVSYAEVLSYLLSDPDTACIACYLESAAEAAELSELLGDSNAHKPIVMLRGGKSVQGSRAAASHTASIAGEERLWTALTKQRGIVEVDDLEEFLDVLLAFDAFSQVKAPSTKVLVIGNGGGNSVIVTDQLARAGLDVGELEPVAIAALEGLGIPSGCSFLNPVDIGAVQISVSTASGDVVSAVITTVIEHEPVTDVVVHFNVPIFVKNVPSHREILLRLIEGLGARQEEFPNVRMCLVLRGLLAGVPQELYEELRSEAINQNVPVFYSLTSAARALGAVAAHSEGRSSVADELSKA
ncbi:MAG: acetate--CoA ligase family protein [Acidimicrobiales bacterium]